MADNRLYGGDVVNPAMHGQAQASVKPQSLRGDLGTGRANYIGRESTLEYDPYHRLKIATLKNIGGSLEKTIQAAQDQAYVDGMSKAITGQAEEALEGNLLTRNFAKAGYRDAEGRLSIMNYKASTLDELKNNPELATLPPSEFQEYLGKRRAETMAIVSNSSMQARQKLMEQILTEDMSLIQKHAELYQANAFNTEMGVLNTRLGMVLQQYVSSRGTPDETVAQLGILQGVDDIWSNERLPMDQKQKLIKEFLTSTAKAGAPDVVEAIMGSYTVELPDGESAPLVSLLGLDVVSGVNSATVSARSTYKADLTKELYQNIGAMEDAAQYDLEFDFHGAYNYLWDNVTTGKLSGSEATAIFKRMLKHQQTNTKSVSVIQALRDGNMAFLEENGVSPKKALQSWLQFTTDWSPAQRMEDLMGMISNGNDAAISTLGLIASPALNRFKNKGVEGRIDDDAEVLQYVVNMFQTQAFQEDPTRQFGNFVTSMTDTQTAAFLQSAFHRYNATGVNPRDPAAVASAWEDAMEQARLDLSGIDTTPEAIAIRKREAAEELKRRTTGMLTTNQYAAFNFLRASPLPKAPGKTVQPNARLGNIIPWVNKGDKAASKEIQSRYEQVVLAEADVMFESGVAASAEVVLDLAQANVDQGSFSLSGDGWRGSFIGRPGNDVLNRLRYELGDDLNAHDAGELWQEVVTHFMGEAASLNSATDKSATEFTSVASFHGDRLVVKSWDVSKGMMQIPRNFTFNDIKVEAQNIIRKQSINESIKVDVPGTNVALVNPALYHRGYNDKTGFVILNEEPKTLKEATAFEGIYGVIKNIQLNAVLDQRYAKNLDVEDSMIIAARRSLLQHEGFREAAYEDGGGVTVGIGIGSGNSNFPKYIKKAGDKIKPDDIYPTFVATSTESMSAAYNEARKSPNANQDALFLLYTHMHYQQGSLTNSGYKNRAPVVGMQDAINAESFEEALANLKETRAYITAGNSRKVYYEELLEQVFRRQ